jgi:hypothetical protein
METQTENTEGAQQAVQITTLTLREWLLSHVNSLISVDGTEWYAGEFLTEEESSYQELVQTALRNEEEPPQNQLDREITVSFTDEEDGICEIVKLPPNPSVFIKRSAESD